MLVLASEIHIGQYLFKQIGDVEINSSYDTLTDTATITVPRRLSFKGKTIALNTDPIFRKGDSVKIYLGYGYDNKKLVFTGFVSRIEAGMPTVIHAEDSAMFLKNTKTFNLSYSKLNISELLKTILPSGIEFQVEGEIELGKASFTRVTAAQILKYLQEKFSINAWFRNGILYCGLNYYQELQKDVSAHFQKNIISNSLTFVRADDVLFSVKATSFLPDNSKIEIEVGDKDAGNQRSLHYYGITEKSTLEERATKVLRDIKVDGYNGSITLFGSPQVNHGDRIALQDSYFPERAGTYIAKSVRTTFSTAGFRQEVEVGEKVS